MADVQPFRALRYDPARVDLSQVITPPYDVVSPEERRRFYERDPYCAIRLDLTREVEEESETDYGHVRGLLDGWRSEGVLALDSRPSLYLLRQRFATPEGESHERRGFFAAVRLEDYDRRIVRPHERTLSGPKADRLKLQRASRANLSPIFLVYEDPELELEGVLGTAFEGSDPQVAKDSTGVENLFAPHADPETIREVSRFLSDRPVVIADGHHRYETALAYRDEQRRAHPDAGPDAPFEFTLAYFANAYAPGSLLRPIHRMVVRGAVPSEEHWRTRLPGWRCEEIAVDRPERVPAALAAHLEPLAPAPSFAADDGSGVLRVFSRPARDASELAIRAVHDEVVAQVFDLDEEAVRGGAMLYRKDPVRAAREVRAGEASVALYLNPLRPEDVFRVTAAGEVLPQKSTFFTPKLPTGLVFRLLDRTDAAD